MAKTRRHWITKLICGQTDLQQGHQRHIIRNLMENGIKEASGQLPGKSIIFARNHNHAVLMQQLFDEMYPQYGGKYCQVIDNYDPVPNS